MNKSAMLTLIIKLVAFVLTPILSICLSVSLFPFRFMDGDYAMYLQTYQKVHWGGDYRVLILGDSSGKAGLIPTVLGDDVYNLAVGGFSPIEQYYYLSKYLEKSEPPECIILTYTPYHLMYAPNLWDRAMYFHCFDLGDLKDIYAVIDDYEDVEYVKKEDYQWEVLEYSCYSPIKYSSAFVGGLVSGRRYKRNVEWYDFLTEHDGFSSFGEGDPHGLNYEVDYDHFHCSDLCEYYLKDMLELCYEKGTTVIYETPPMNESSYNQMSQDFIYEYEDFLRGINREYENLIVNEEWAFWEDNNFKDGRHLTMEGAEQYSNMIYNKYKNLFTGGQS